MLLSPFSCLLRFSNLSKWGLIKTICKYLHITNSMFQSCSNQFRGYECIRECLSFVKRIIMIPSFFEEFYKYTEGFSMVLYSTVL